MKIANRVKVLIVLVCQRLSRRQRLNKKHDAEKKKRVYVLKNEEDYVCPKASSKKNINEVINDISTKMTRFRGETDDELLDFRGSTPDQKAAACGGLGISFFFGWTFSLGAGFALAFLGSGTLSVREKLQETMGQETLPLSLSVCLVMFVCVCVCVLSFRFWCEAFFGRTLHPRLCCRSVESYPT